MRSRMRTPWGQSNFEEELVDGIVWYSTPSHGGYHLDAGHSDTLRDRFPDHVPYAGTGWYEEDQDWSVVALTWPELFTIKEVAAAVKTARASARNIWTTEPNAAWQTVVDWLDSDRPSARMIRAAAEASKNIGLAIG